MKNYIILLTIILLNQNLFPQNWPTIGGKNERNGLSKIIGPDSVITPIWTVTSSPTNIGNSIFTFGDKFVTARSVFNPYTSKIECRSLTNGSLIWEKMVYTTSRMFAVGFTEDAVYAHDYFNDTLYALSPEDGSVKWAVKETMFGGNTGILFAENGDPIVKGKRLNRKNGQVKWTYNYIVPVSPNPGYAANQNTFYHFSGSIMTPIKLFALDIQTGQLNYESDALPGDADQEMPITIGNDGKIYIKRDGGKLYAFEDTGTQLRIKWEYIPTANEMPGLFASDKNGNIYVIDNDTVKLLSSADGSVITKSLINIKSSFYPTISIDGEGKVYVCNNEAALGKMVCFSADLQQVIWQIDVPYITYCGPALSKDGTLIITGSGNTISAYKPSGRFKPAADFRTSGRDILAGNTVSFFDQSSYDPTSWQWYFEGGIPSSSTLKNPENIRYNSPGIYEVKLIATNQFGSDTLVKKQYIEVENPINVNDEFIADNFELYQNYPNPFNPSTKIIWQSPVVSYTTLKVYDVLGNEVATLVDEYRDSGSHEVEFNVAQAISLCSGVYFYRLSAGNFVQTKKMILMK